mmetsp:Transcript_19006/g.67116  ORF Transcript_19006/g.67116 Transcript_19006/m.67116 type:complete len:206 (-) Transcript_19006:547-1164(-)
MNCTASTRGSDSRRRSTTHSASRPSTSDRFVKLPLRFSLTPSDRSLIWFLAPAPPSMLHTSLRWPSERTDGGSASVSWHVIVTRTLKPSTASSALPRSPSDGTDGDGFVSALPRHVMSTFWNSSASCCFGMPRPSVSPNCGNAWRRRARNRSGRTGSTLESSSPMSPRSSAATATVPSMPPEPSHSLSALRISGTWRKHSRVEFM